MAISIENTITAEDLGEPYDVLVYKIGITDTFKFANKFHGRELRFNKNTYKQLFEEISEIFNDEITEKIIRVYWGDKIYFPKIRKTCRMKINEAIRDNFDGSNHAELAKIFDYCERHIYRILEGKGDWNNNIDEYQMNLFDKM